MSEHYDQALVDELGEIVADMLLEESGALTRSTGFCVATGRVAAAVLDRLVELGWRQSCGVVLRGDESVTCELPRDDHRTHRGQGIVWGACELDYRR